jgi:hypothetical protein
MKIYLKKFGYIFLLICFLSNTVKAATTYDWTGLTSSSWTNPLNWLAGGLPTLNYPGQTGNTDIVQFGVNPLVALFLNQPTLSSSVTISAINFGPNQFINVIGLLFNGTTLTVNGATLSVTNAIIQNINTNAIGSSAINNFLLGTGTITCGSIQVGSGTGNTTNYNFLFSEVKTLNVTGNLTVIMNTAQQNGCGFRLQAGSMTLGGQIKFTTVSGVSSTNAGYFTINATNSTGINSSPTLTLTNASAIATPLPQTGVLNMATVNFNGTSLSGGKATVIYTAASPTVYTTSTKGFGSGGGTINTNASTYDNLVVNGSGTATIGAGATAGILMLDSILTTSSNTTFANAATTTTVGTNWQNDATSTITGGTGTTSIVRSLTNAGVMNMVSGNITIGSNYTNTGTFTQAAAASDPTLTSPVPTNTTYFTSTLPVLKNTLATNITTFNNLVFTGGSTTAASLTGSGQFIIASKGVLLLKTTGITLQANGLLTLKSDALSSAAVATILSGSTIAGIVNVERFITGGASALNRGYRLLSCPVNQTGTTSALTNTFGLSYLKDHTYNGITYTGAYTGGILGPSAGFSIASVGPTITLFDERKVNNNTAYSAGKNIGVTRITTTGATSGPTTSTLNLTDISAGTLSIPVGNGFEMFFIGPSTRFNSSSATLPDDATLTANGYLNQQNVTVNLWHTPNAGAVTGTAGNLSYTSSLTAINAGFNMVGNPYASTIDLQKVLTDNPATVNNIYLLSAKNYPNQTYIAFTASGTSAPSPGYAVSGEGFFVQAKASGGPLTFKESEKASSIQLSGAALIMSVPKNNVLTADGRGIVESSFKTSPLNVQTRLNADSLIGLYMKIQRDSVTYNYCGIYFGSQWSKNFQAGDAGDMDGNSPQVMMSSFSADGVRSAVKHFPEYQKGAKIRLYANGKTDGMYTLSTEGIRNIDTANYKITLIDHFKNDSTDIGRYHSYKFNVVKSDTSTFGGYRFELSISQLAASKYQLVTFTAQKAADGVLLTWRTLNEENNYFFTLEKQQANGTDYSPLYNTQSNGGTIYKYTDKTPNTGNNVYRLKQVDLFGNITYSNAINVYYDKTGNESMFSVYPNPTAETLNINVTYGKTNAATSSYKLNIYDATGSLVMQKTSANAAWNENVSQFKPGIYIVELKAGDGNLLGKVKLLKQ